MQRAYSPTLFQPATCRKFMKQFFIASLMVLAATPLLAAEPSAACAAMASAADGAASGKGRGKAGSGENNIQFHIMYIVLLQAPFQPRQLKRQYGALLLGLKLFLSFWEALCKTPACSRF